MFPAGKVLIWRYKWRDPLQATWSGAYLVRSEALPTVDREQWLSHNMCSR